MLICVNQLSWKVIYVVPMMFGQYRLKIVKTTGNIHVCRQIKHAQYACCLLIRTISMRFEEGYVTT